MSHKPEDELAASSSLHPEWPRRPDQPVAGNKAKWSTWGVVIAVVLFMTVGISGMYLFYRYPEAQQHLGLQAALLDTRPAPSLEQVPAASSATPAPAQTSLVATSPQPSPSATPRPTLAPSATATRAATGSPTPALSATPSWVTDELAPLPEGKWIEVDLGRQVAVAWNGPQRVFTLTISSGIEVTNTSAGKYDISEKRASSLLTGPGYYLPDVPWVMVVTQQIMFDGAYWLDTFGEPSRHGSINLSPEDAKRLFDWAEPALPQGAASVKADERHPGTSVIIHP